MTHNNVMDQGALGPRPEPAVGEEESPALDRPPRMMRVRLWQAIAGMSAAVALASLIVVSELAALRAHQTNYVNRREAALNATVRSLQRQTATERRKLGSARERVSEGEAYQKILFAPDLRIIKLSAPTEKEKGKEKSGAQAAVGAAPNGVVPSGAIAMSESNQAAMLEASGLKPTDTFQVYRIWWMPKRGVPIWAADFLVGDDGLATAPVDLPTGRERNMSLEITLEDESYSEEPNGPVALTDEVPLNRRRARR